MEQALLLLSFVIANPSLKTISDPQALFDALKEAAAPREVYFIKHEENPVGEEVALAQPTLSLHRSAVAFKHPLVDWHVTLDFFSSAEVAKLISRHNIVDALSKPWTLQVIDKDRAIAGKTFVEFMQAIVKISKPYMTIQRYKGLGEMNPEQLWETSMDPARRTLLKVSVGDALEADAWFDTLMGDDVAGRKVFIEENGQFVKFLDV